MRFTCILICVFFEFNFLCLKVCAHMHPGSKRTRGGGEGGGKGGKIKMDSLDSESECSKEVDIGGMVLAAGCLHGTYRI